MKTEDLQAYHKIIATTYDARSSSYDERSWQIKVALRLVEELPVEVGQKVLDIASGSGCIAFHTAKQVGPTGTVVGIDLSGDMIALANEKLAASKLENLEFILADAENLEFPKNSFDRIYCGSSFFWILDPAATLKHWCDLLNPGGNIAFHALPNTSYIWVSVAQRVLDSYDISYTLNRCTGSVDMSQQLMSKAGFKNINIRVEELGQYISLEYAKSMWLKEGGFSPGQYPHPLLNVPSETLLKAQQDYDTILEELNTDKGVWNDLSMYYIYAEK